MEDPRTERAIRAAATKFDWTHFTHGMEDQCECGYDGVEGTEGMVYDPLVNPCPACQERVKPLVVAALAAIGLR